MKKLRISFALYNVFLQVSRGVRNPYMYSAGQNKANNADATQTHGRVSSDAWTHQLRCEDASALTGTCVRQTRQAGKDFSFVIYYYSFASCGIVMINKTNCEV